MSEFNPFSAIEEAPAYVAEESEEGAGGRKKVVLLGALAGVAVAAGAFLFLGGGDDEELDDFAVPPRAAAAAPAPAAEPGATLPVASKATLGRNPFRALYVEPAAAAAAPADSTGTAPAAPTTGTTTPIVIVDGGPAQPAPAQPAPAQPAPAQPAPEPAQSTLSLKSVAAGEDGANPTATFVYDGKEVSGAPGDVMDGKLLVISIQQDSTGGWFANLQLGDGEPFEVHERQTVVVH